MESFARPAVFGRFLTRDRPWVVDLALALVFVVIGALGSPTMSWATTTQTVYTLVVIGCAGILVIRRIRPLLTLTIIGVLLVVHLLLVREPGIFAGAVCALAIYTTQTQLVPPWRWLVPIAIFLGAWAAILTAPALTDNTAWATRATFAAFVTIVLTVALLAGVIRRDRKARYQGALERAASLEARREIETRLAAAEERARIAREMHDVLGHSLNVIAVQAEGVRLVARTEPDRADQILAGIGELSRNAVDDIKGLIDVLATDDEEAPVRPAPSLRDIPMLIDDLRYTTGPIRLQVEGDLTRVPGPVGLAGYRIVQESLTNVLKHAHGAAVRIHIAVGVQQVDITILNTATADSGTSTDTENRHGLVGMQERARAVGGTLTAGPEPSTGGWRVSASLPWSRP
ncbi:sensor histidine kinase [Enemella sp. A6]|uniref:sensor histidine kinase n=1 Tax=Enemella sp. A6 TaxID=3440152 RepID=UPI003EBA72AD